MFSTLVSPQTLYPHLNDSTWLVADCRFDLQDPDWGFMEYQKNHIPGAIYAHLDRDLSDPISPTTGRHPLPSIEEMHRRFSAMGIGKETQVVVYDHQGGAYASRLWWMLRAMGHPAVAVLNGGYPAWVARGYPTRPGIETRPAAHFSGETRLAWAVDADEVERIRTDPAYRLIDARSPIRYRGEQEPIDKEAGHIPGALNRFHGKNLTPEGFFLPPEGLRQQFLELIQDTPPENVAVYCGSGVTSCHHILAMEVAGLPGARLYPGSWSEWIRDPARPRAVGS